MRFLLFNIAVVAALAYLAGGLGSISNRVLTTSLDAPPRERTPLSPSAPATATAAPPEQFSSGRLAPDVTASPASAEPAADRPVRPLPPPVERQVQNAEPLTAIEVPERPQPPALDPKRNDEAPSADERRRALFDLTQRMELLAAEAARPTRR